MEGHQEQWWLTSENVKQASSFLIFQPQSNISDNYTARAVLKKMGHETVSTYIKGLKNRNSIVTFPSNNFLHASSSLKTNVMWTSFMCFHVKKHEWLSCYTLKLLAETCVQRRCEQVSQSGVSRWNSRFCHHCDRCDRCRSRKRFYFLWNLSRNRSSKSFTKPTMLHGATPVETCFATPLHTSFTQKFQRVNITAALLCQGTTNEQYGQTPRLNQLICLSFLFIS